MDLKLYFKSVQFLYSARNSVSKKVPILSM